MSRSFLLIPLFACSTKPAEPTGAPSADKGKSAYMTYCTACHSADPSKDGAIGPAVKGSSKALLEARILKASYPDGYTPKRDTKNMVALPHVAPHIDDLTEYLK